MYKSGASYVSCRAGVYYYIRCVPYDARQHYASKRLSFSLKTKSYAGALRAAQSVTQRLEDYWLGLRLQDMDIPAIHLVRTNHEDNSSPLMLLRNTFVSKVTMTVSLSEQPNAMATIWLSY